MTERASSSRLLRLLAIAFVLTLTFWSAVSSLVQKSPTFDEQGFIVRGLAYLRPPEQGGTRDIRVGHPPGLNAYNALLMATDESVRLPVDDPSWQETSFHRPAELFLWEIGNAVAHIMFLTRIQTVWLGLLLISLAGRWAAELAADGVWRNVGGNARTTRTPAGLLAITVTAFDPNLLAHMQLATTDFGLTATAAFAGYGTWKLARQPSWKSAVLAGLGAGLMLNTKFTAILFVPFLGLVLLVGLVSKWRASKGSADPRPRSLLIPFVLIFPVSTLLTLWAGTGFDIVTVPDYVPFVGGATLPLGHYLGQLLDIGGRLQVETPAFLLRQYSPTGWWYYFPIAFLVKTPVPTLALLLGAMVSTGVTLWVRRRKVAWSDIVDLLALLLPAAGFFAISLTTEINLGYRHIMPVLPFLFVFTGASLGKVFDAAANPLSRKTTPRRIAAWVVVGLSATLAFVSLRIHPHYLAYFNVLAGGPDYGWRALVDSNLDWGQDLEALRPWMADNGVDQVWLSYFGEARPEYYGIAYKGLDSFPPRLMNPEARPFVPSDPAPGWYAISATNLQGVHFSDHDQFAYFRQREPDDKLGYSIFLFNVPAHGEPANLLLSGLQPDQIAPQDWGLLSTNDLTLRWLDGQQTVITPSDGRPSWLIAAADAPLSSDWQMILNDAVAVPTVSELGYSLYRLPDDPPDAGVVQSTFELGEGSIGLLDSTTVTQNGRQLSIITAWQQLAEPAPVKIFIHVLDEAGAIVSQWDGLGAAWVGWRESDVLRETHTLELPPDAPNGRYRVVTGLYDPETLERWRLPSGSEFVESAEITIP